VGLFLIGYDPYITNTVFYGNPFYPTYSNTIYNKDALLRGQIPENFVGKNRFEKLFLATFSRAQNTYLGTTGLLKFPLALNYAELKAYVGPDLRVGGFGPFFGAITILAGFCLLISDEQNRSTCIPPAYPR
jgi:hypothetical protein